MDSVPEAPAAQEATPGSSSSRTRRLALIPPAILVAVALVQPVLVARVGLSPWKGGGFGMFCTTDHGPSRSVQVFAIGEDDVHALRLPRELRSLASRVEHGPVVPLVRRLAERAAEDARDEGDDVRRVRVRVSRIVYDVRWLEPSEQVVREVEIDVPPRDAR